MQIDGTGLRRRIGAALAIAAAALVAGLLGLTPAAAGDTPPAPGPVMTKCQNQVYALCAQAECTVFDGVTYCKCRVRHGTSISLTQRYKGEDVCDIMAEGKGNGYIVSTYSPPPELLAPNGDLAVYQCPQATTNGSYAQCDGGLCYRSTQGKTFFGFEGQLEKDQIICSCPIVTADPETSKVGYEILGPYPCKESWFKYCKKAVSNTNNGSTMYVGAPSERGFQFTTSRYLDRPVTLRTCSRGG